MNNDIPRAIKITMAAMATGIVLTNQVQDHGLELSDIPDVIRAMVEAHTAAFKKMNERRASREQEDDER